MAKPKSTTEPRTQLNTWIPWSLRQDLEAYVSANNLTIVDVVTSALTKEINGSPTRKTRKKTT